jgi:hypothetical protein
MEPAQEGRLARAVGKVWTVMVDSATAQRMQASERISAMVSRPNGVLLRVVGATRPHPDAVPAEPTLEDAYLLAAGIECAAA